MHLLLLKMKEMLRMLFLVVKEKNYMAQRSILNGPKLVEDLREVEVKEEVMEEEMVAMNVEDQVTLQEIVVQDAEVQEEVEEVVQEVQEEVVQEVQRIQEAQAQREEVVLKAQQAEEMKEIAKVPNIRADLQAQEDLQQIKLS